MRVGNSCQNSLTPNSRFCEAFEPSGQVFLKTITQEVHCKQNLEMHMELAQCDQAIMNITIKHGLTKQEQSL